MTVRSRSISFEEANGYVEVISNGVVTTHLPSTAYSRGFQITDSEGHRVSQLGKDEDIGGSFSSQCITINPGWEYVDITTLSSPGIYKRSNGPVAAWSTTDNKTSSGLLVPYSTLQMNGFGATGIARALPTNPLSNMGQFIGELRDLPRLPFHDWKGRAREFKSLARRGSNEYLNVQFGWIPFVNDIVSAIKVVRNSSKIVRQYSRDSGRVVRRGSTISSDSTSTTSTVSNSWYGVPAFDPVHVLRAGQLLRTDQTNTHIYFRGAFTYYLPSDSTLLGKLERYEAYANRMFGVRLDPDLLWKLAPWSWAADWVGNIGDNVRNWSHFTLDDLVLRYGYVMASKETITSYALNGLVLKNGRTLNLTQTYRNSSKQRVKATPYGFGLNPSSFSAKQWSIIAALGISKKPRALN